MPSAPPPRPPPPLAPTTAVILCGGRGARMGLADKGLLRWRGKPLVEQVIARIAPQVASLVLSCNRNLSRYRGYGWPLALDRHADFRGPLAGVAASLAYCHTPWLLVCPCDCPRLPAALMQRLGAALASPEAEIAVAHDGQRRQHLIFLMRRALGAALLDFHADGQRRAVRDWLDSRRVVTADFADMPERFLNVNAPQERQR